MKENKNKFVKFGVFFIILFIIGFIGLNITKLINYNLKIENGNFLEVDIISLVDTIIHFIELIVNIAIGYFLMYFFTKKDNKISKQKEVIEKLIIKTQDYINEKNITNITEKNITENELILNLQIRKISNQLNYLKKFSIKFDYSSLIEDAIKNFYLFKEAISNMREDKDFTHKSQNNLIRLIDLVDNKLEEILVKIYE